MQMNFDTSDSCVNTLIVADFNLLSRAIQGDTQRFELMERFIKGFFNFRSSEMGFQFEHF